MWHARRLTGLARPEHNASISFGLPFEPEDCQYGRSPLITWSCLLNDVISGFAAGFAVTLVVGIYVQIRKSLLRRDQVRHFRELVLREIRQIQSTEEQGPIYEQSPGGTLNPDLLRNTYYDRMRLLVNGAIEHRASEITYDEIRELQDAFHAVNWLIDKGHRLSKEGFDQMSEKVRNVRWLRIPPL